MNSILVAPDSCLDRRLRRLMALAGVLMVLAPAAEIGVQLAFGERPQILLLGGFFLVGILTVTHALPRQSPRWFSGTALPTRTIRGEALWLSERER